MATVKQVSDGGPDGLKIGQSVTDLVAFHGVTPIACATVAALTSGSLGDANTAVNAVITALKNKGIIQ